MLLQACDEIDELLPLICHVICGFIHGFNYMYHNERWFYHKIPYVVNFGIYPGFLQMKFQL